MSSPAVTRPSPVPVDDGVEGEAVPPGGGEVADPDPWVPLRGPLGPPQQRVLRVNAVISLHYVRYLANRGAAMSETSTNRHNMGHSEYRQFGLWRRVEL